MAQIMEQFHVLVRLVTVLGNQYGYNFKSPKNNCCEPDSVSVQMDEILFFYVSILKLANRTVNFQLLLCGDEAAERLAYEVACELGYATPDGMQASILNSHAPLFKVNMKLECLFNQQVSFRT